MNIVVPINGDGDHDEIAVGARAHRSRPKRRKSSAHQRGRRRDLVGRVLRWLPLILFALAIVLLFVEYSKLNENRPDDVEPSIVVRESEEPRTNLNRIDSKSRAVNGVREPCLKILSPEKIQNLDFPGTTKLKFPVKQVSYKSVSVEQQLERNYSVVQEKNVTRFNLFTGYQSMDEREESFKVNETVMVHCGFYSESGGFAISEVDKNYMQTCQVVVSTCAFGGGDDLCQPIGMTETSLKKVCYVAFWDDITLAAQEAEGKTIGNDNMIGKWRIVVVKDLPFSDQRLNGKIPKMLAHRLFPEARYSIWVDSKSQFRRDPIGVLEILLWKTKSVLAISEHGARSSLYDEGKAVVKKHKATPEEVELQLSQYQLEGIPDSKRFNGKKALAEASVIVREHTPATNLLMCLWFNEVVRFTSRDQLSFPYVLRRLNIPGINMIPVCTRKDLVNSIGHKRKAKPLVKTTR